MSGTDRDKWDAQDLIQWQEARRWLAKADEDLLAAQRLLPEIVNQAAFHVHYPGLEEVALSTFDVTAALALVSDFITVVRSHGPPDRS